MAVCSFVGQSNIYDTDVLSRLSAAIDSILLDHEKVEFLLRYEFGSYFCSYLTAVLQAKSRFPQKVTITLVLDEWKDDLWLQASSHVPLCAADTVVVPVSKQAGMDGVVRAKRVQRWMTGQSTHIVSYIYRFCGELDVLFMDRLNNSPDLNIIDITEAATTQAIYEQSRLLTERQQFILHKLAEGLTLKEIGALVGLSQERVRQTRRKACKELRDYAENRCRTAMAGKKKRLWVCGIFHMGDATYTSLNYFCHVIDSIMKAFHVKNFEVQGSYCQTGFIYVLRKDVASPIERITAVIDDPYLLEEENDDVMGRFCPPCDAVKHVGNAIPENRLYDMGVIAAIVDQCDFCICNLSASPAAEEIRSYIAQSNRAVLLDLGNKPEGMELEMR